MNSNKNDKLSTDPYKGVRDFYPEDMFIQNYLFGVMRKVVEQFGYQEYGASILEPSELYKAKSGEEIVNDQTYTFIDRGDRDVTLRPEMTPTVTRMVAARKRELVFPLRWYSIPNLFRYEKPQRGRLREHYQLNVDLFGVESLAGELEVIELAHNLLLQYGATKESFVIKVTSRKILNYLLGGVFKLEDKDIYSVTKLIDKKSKIGDEEFQKLTTTIMGNKASVLTTILSSKNIQEFSNQVAEIVQSEIAGAAEVEELLKNLAALGITNVVFDPTLARGFDYYTGIVFEVFDTNPENARSLFGGGRYDDLLSVFGSDKVPAVGFGLGDVTLRDFLTTHNLLPTYSSSVDLMICLVTHEVTREAMQLADELRKNNIGVAIDLSGKKVGQQIQSASKRAIRFIVCIGEDEITKKTYTVKNLETSTETVCGSVEDIISLVSQPRA